MSISTGISARRFPRTNERTKEHALVHFGDPGCVPLRELLRDPVGHRRVDPVRDVRGQSSFPPQVWASDEKKHTHMTRQEGLRIQQDTVGTR